MYSLLDREDIKKSETPEEIRNILYDRGAEFEIDDENEYLQFYAGVKKRWYELNKPELRKVDDLKEHPHRTVEKDGTKYNIYGIVHGMVGLLGYINKDYVLSNDVKNFIKVTIDSKPCDSRLFERGFKRIFNVSGKEINDSKLLMPKKGGFCGVFEGISKIKKFAKRAKKITKGIGYKKEIKKSFKYPCKYVEYIPYGLSFSEAYNLPSPLKGNFLMNIDHFYWTIQTGRSRYMTDYAQEHAKEKGRLGRKLDEVNIFTGASHMPEIEYFLRND